MKKAVLTMLVFLFVIGLAAVESKIRFGFLSPKDAETGFMGGITYGNRIDNAVALDMSADFYINSYEKKRSIYSGSTEGDNTFTTVKKTAEMNTTYVPLQGNLTINLPVQSSLKPYFTAGIGWGLLWEDVYRAAFVGEDGTTVPQYDEVKFYNGFNWGLAGGVSYKLGNRSNIFGELFYNGGKMKRDFEQTAYGITWDEIDMGGIGLRVGVEFSYNPQ